MKSPDTEHIYEGSNHWKGSKMLFAKIPTAKAAEGLPSGGRTKAGARRTEPPSRTQSRAWGRAALTRRKEQLPQRAGGRPGPAGSVTFSVLCHPFHYPPSSAVLRAALAERPPLGRAEEAAAAAAPAPPPPPPAAPAAPRHASERYQGLRAAAATSAPRHPRWGGPRLSAWCRA